MKLATLIPCERLCALAAVSRAGFYRWRERQPGAEADLDLRDQIQRIALEWPWLAPGDGRVTAAELDGEPQAGAAPDAGGQPAVSAPEEVRGDHRLESRPAGLPEPGR